MSLSFDLDKIINLRHELHKFPELSDNEFLTSERIANFLAEYKNTELIRGIGGNGIACIIKGKNEGPSVLFRADLDALPIDEINNFEYKSTEKGVAHKCGHDGHMAIIAGLADVFSKNPPDRGQVVLFFQPSEENGQGAHRVVNDEKFKKIKVDYAFALHNLPGFPKGNVLLRDETFAAASKGMIIKLTGKTSHAGEPENGNSPAVAMADIIKQLNDLPNKKGLFSDFTLLTVIHARLGEVAFGTTPGYAEVMATLRTYTNEDMQKLTSACEDIAEENAQISNLRIEIEYVEEFPATINAHEMVQCIQKASEKSGIEYQYLETPFRWSEDFAHFTQKFEGALFGLGSGTEHPQLHNPDYDFPDEIIENGVNIFYEIYNQIIKTD
ncbi:MAG: amidohydrolase [Bacteroidetes bacterium]|nr:amidohydrolase [Bacteroidota bacterium]